MIFMVYKTKMIVELEKQEIFIIRELDAPRELVFKAFVDPKLYSQWLGPRRLTTEFKSLKQKMAEATDLSTKRKRVTNSCFMVCTMKFLRQSELLVRLNLRGCQKKGM
jgi:uncharacterized protein YndB with AHSA1/START domain